MDYIFWLCTSLIIYTYVGYPVVWYLLSVIYSKKTNISDQYFPHVSIIIAAYNEEDSIMRKLDNTYELDYPVDKYEVIVASDASTDNTDKIVQDYPYNNPILLRIEGRLGKTAIQNAAVKMCAGEILVFTDATTYLKKDALKMIVRNFNDRSVGVVGGDLTYIGQDSGSVSTGGVSYWNFEKNLKRMESSLTSLIGVSGCFYAVRKSAYSDIAPHLISDFVVALQAVQNGYRVIYEQFAQCEEETFRIPEKEYAMRVRVALRSMWALWEKRDLLNIKKYKLFAIQLFSHKVLRYSTVIFMIMIFLSNLFLLTTNHFYLATFIMQIAIYSISMYGYLMRSSVHKCRLCKKAYYFMLIHYAALIAFIKFIKGERQVIWVPVRNG